MAIKMRVSEGTTIGMKIQSDQDIRFSFGETHEVSVRDYEQLDNKPQIEGVTLIGDKSFEELNLQKVTNAEIEVLFSNL